MNKTDFNQAAKNWRWIKILIPLWAIFTGLMLLFTHSPNAKNILITISIGFILALMATAFCVKCYVFYLREYEKKQLDQLKKLEDEIKQLEDT